MATLSMEDVDNIVCRATNEQFKSYLHANKIKLDSICLGGTIMASIAGIGDPKFLAFITGAAVANLGNTVVKAYNDAYKFGREYRMELLEHTPEYQECKRNYNIFVAKIGDFIHSLGITDSLDVGMIYMEMLYNGFLSAPGSFKYHKFNMDYDMCTPLMGARVTSGGAVCRHIASNLRDVYRYLGFPSIYLAVTGTHNTLKDSIIDKILPHVPNHAVVLVGENYGKYIIDPTWKTIAEFGRSSDFADIVYNRGEHPLYHIDNDMTAKLSKTFDYNDYLILRGTRPVHFARGEVRQAQEYARNFVQNNYYRFANLSYRLREEMNNTAILERMLSGYGDVPLIATQKRLIRK